MNADGDLVVEGEEDGELRTIDALEAKYLDIKAQHPDGRWLPIGHPVIAAYFAEEES
jgi:hypothetical protein